jgi:SAM-dependent methyltransferase
MRKRDNHDWTSEEYVDEWVRRQQGKDPARTEELHRICDLFPFSADAAVTILDVGAGYGLLSRCVLERCPRATCVGHDGSEPMLRRARSLLESHGERFRTHRSDLFDPGWLPRAFAPFAAVVSVKCFHNLADFGRVREIYREIREHLAPGGVFLSFDRLAPGTSELRRRYADAFVARGRRQNLPAAGMEKRLARRERAVHGPDDSLLGTLDQHLGALEAAGFRDVDCFWKDLHRTLIGGYAGTRPDALPVRSRDSERRHT